MTVLCKIKAWYAAIASIFFCGHTEICSNCQYLFLWAPTIRAVSVSELNHKKWIGLLLSKTWERGAGATLCNDIFLTTFPCAALANFQGFWATFSQPSVPEQTFRNACPRWISSLSWEQALGVLDCSHVVLERARSAGAGRAWERFEMGPMKWWQVS